MADMLLYTRNDPPASSAMDQAENDRVNNHENGCSSSLQSHEVHHPSSSSSILPRMIVVTVPKRVDQPAGLTLQFRKSDAAKKKKKQQRRRRTKSSSRPIAAGLGEATSVGSGHGSGGSSTKSRQQQHSPSSSSSSGGSSSVIVTSMSLESPFHPDNHIITNNYSNTLLQIGDEILTINGHRVKDPKRAAQMIKSTTSGYLTIVASRGREHMMGITHTIYHLARVEYNPYVLESNWQQENKEVHKVQELRLGAAGEESMTFHVSNNGTLVRISSIVKERCPFVKTGLKVGDVVLSIDGTAVRWVEEAERLLVMDAKNQGKNSIDGQTNGSSNSSRVVALLVYSFWDMRKQVLHDELQLGKSDSDEQMWQVSWSYDQQKQQQQQDEQTKEERSGEFVILQIPNGL